MVTDCSECERVKEALQEILKQNLSDKEFMQWKGPSVTTEELAEVVGNVINRLRREIDDA